MIPTAMMTIPAMISLFRSNHANLVVSRPRNESHTIPTIPSMVARTQTPIAASDEKTPRVLAARKIGMASAQGLAPRMMPKPYVVPMVTWE